MPDIEKVKRALRCCIEWPPKCEICPYRINEEETCVMIDTMLRDALAVIEALQINELNREIDALRDAMKGEAMDD